MQKRLLMTGLGLLSLSLLLFACGAKTQPKQPAAVAPGQDIRLEAPADYSPKDKTITIVLKNDSRNDIQTGYVFELERQTETGWEPVDLQAFTQSTVPIEFAGCGIIVKAGESHTFEEDCLSYAKAGETYRFTYFYDLDEPTAPASDAEPVSIPLQCVVKVK